MTVSTPAATSAPASVPRNAGIRASPLATAEVRINDSVASSTQNPWERSSRSAARRAAARPSASRTAFWKYTERGVKWAASLRHHSSAVGMSRYQADRGGSAVGSGGAPVAVRTAKTTPMAASPTAAVRPPIRATGGSSSPVSLPAIRSTRPSR